MAALRYSLLAVLCLLWSGLPAQAASRVALVIGNAGYTHVSPLPNPANDAADIAATLKRIGFDVQLETNLDFDGMRRALRDFNDRALGSDIAIIYYAGHGFEMDKQNYLVPTDAKLARDRDIPYEAIPLDLAQAAVEGARELKLVLLDACRNNPFAAQMQVTSATRSIGRGLARVEPTPGTLIGFAAKEGTVAEDGKGRNSPYAGALLANLAKPGLEVNFLFRKVHDDVMQATDGRQQPFIHGALPGRSIYLVPPAEEPATPAAPAPQASPDVQVEIAFWETIKDSNDPKQFKAYLEQYPSGKFVVLANLLLKQLETKQAIRESTPEPEAPKAEAAAPEKPAAAEKKAAAPAAPQPEKKAQPAQPPRKEKPPAKQKVAVAPKPPAEAETFRPNSVCRSWLSKFRNGHRPHAAFAVAANGSCGWSAGGLSSVKAAVSQALSECRKQHPKCKVIATK